MGTVLFAFIYLSIIFQTENFISLQIGLLMLICVMPMNLRLYWYSGVKDSKNVAWPFAYTKVSDSQSLLLLP